MTSVEQLGSWGNETTFLLPATKQPHTMSALAQSKGQWPNGARAAVAFTIDNMGEAADLDRGLWPEEKPVGSHYSVNEVLPQMLDLLKRYGIPVTYFVESWNLAVYPAAINSIASAGHEVAWHAFRHEAWGKLSPESETDNFRRSFDAYAKFADGEGKGSVDRYHGFRPPGGTIHGQQTLKLCHDYGLDYVSPSAEDAALVKLEDSDDSIVVLPFKWRTVDAYYVMDSFEGLRKMKQELPAETQSYDTVAQSYIAEIDRAIETGGYVSTLFHPFLSNSDEAFAAIDRVLKHMARQRDEGPIWLARCKDISDHIKAHPSIVGSDPKWDNSSWR